MNTDQRSRADALRAAKQALSQPSFSLTPGKKPTRSSLSDLLLLSQWILRGDAVLEDWEF